MCLIWTQLQSQRTTSPGRMLPECCIRSFPEMRGGVFYNLKSLIHDGAGAHGGGARLAYGATLTCQAFGKKMICRTNSSAQLVLTFDRWDEAGDQSKSVDRSRTHTPMRCDIFRLEIGANVQNSFDKRLAWAPRRKINTETHPNMLASRAER